MVRIPYTLLSKPVSSKKNPAMILPWNSTSDVPKFNASKSLKDALA
jgi:hypothetical protein